jgi:predicted nuclease of predicted toxin-antitoxin system
MKFLIDANLSFKLASALRSRGYDVLHTDDLPDKERTSDKKIREVSVRQNRTIISKDSDFLDSLLISGVPSKLLLVTTGNIINKELLLLFEKYFDSIVQLFDLYDLIELDNLQIIVHEK